MDEVIEFLRSLVRKIKVPSKFIWPTALVLSTAWYILNPSGRPHITVPGNYLAFDLPPFRRCDVSFLSTVWIQSYGIANATDAAATFTGASTTVHSVPVSRELAVLTVTNPYPVQVQQAAALNLPHRVRVYMGPSVSAEIGAVSVDGREVDLKLFFRRQLKVHGQLIRFRYIRVTLADFLYSVNDAGANWLLTFMFFFIVWLVLTLAGMEARAYVYSDGRFENYLAKVVRIDVAEIKASGSAFDKYVAHWARWDKRLRYFQALGPALGFILTVSSLVEALHPALRTANDLDSFLKGIHVAMISTFLGLLIRIIAMEAARVNDKALARAAVQLPDVSGEDDPSVP